MKRAVEMVDLAEPNAGWGGRIPDDEWTIYRRVLDGMRDAGVEFALGGAFALATYSGHWRNTKDLDLYILPEDRERAVEVTGRAGLTDYFDVLPYDRAWIYRAHDGVTIVDSIWAMANRRTVVDRHWIFGGPSIDLRGESLRVVPVEEMIWGKLYIVQRPRCDWPDIFNMLYGVGHVLDWEYLIARVEEDRPLLAGMLSTFAWVCPGRASTFPAWIWDRLGLALPEDGPLYDKRRVDLFDTRPWFVEDLEK
jgi:hypothetical protein